jgi:hypothetical protein
MGIADFLKGLVSPITDLIGKAIPDKDLAAQLSTQIEALLINADTSVVTQQAGVITAEAKSDSWLARNWRPMTMLTFVFIVANNFIIAPYAQAIFHQSVSLPTPPDLWELIKIGLGGYVVGRSGEKIMTAWASKGQ